MTASKKSTKRALLSSVLALIVCISMLIGTTFAWFTDSVTSGRNIIQSGNLDIDLMYSADEGKTWNSVEAATDVFAENLWEPGFAKKVLFKAINNGSLALRYEMNVTIYNEAAGINKAGELFNLSDYIYTAIVDKDADRETILAGNGQKLSAGIALKDESCILKNKGDVSEFAIALWMPTSVDNEANHNGVTVPKIELGIALNATQMTSETDSFGTDYDADAYWPTNAVAPEDIDETAKTMTIKKAGELAWLANMVNGDGATTFALNANAKNNFEGWTITLGADIDLGNLSWKPIGAKVNDANFKGTFDGNGKTIRNLNVRASKSAGLFGNVIGTVKNLNVENATVYGNDYVGVLVGYLYGTIDNCKVTNANLEATPYLTGNKYDGGAKVGALVGYLAEGNNKIVNSEASKVTVKGYRDIGAIAGLAHKGSKIEGVKASDSKVSYIKLSSVYPYDSNTPNNNIGTIAGRVYPTTTISGCTSDNVLLSDGAKKLALDEGSLEAALTVGGEVSVEKDVTITEQITVPSDVSVVLNMDGKEITGNYHKDNGAVIRNEGELTIVGGTINSTADNGGSAIMNKGTLTVTDAVLNGAPNAGESWPSYTVNNKGVMTVSDSKITSVHGAVCSYGSGAVLTLDNTDIAMSGIPGFTSHGIYTYDGGKVIVNGGNIANNAADQNATGASVINGNVVVNSGNFTGRIMNYYGTPSLAGGTYSVNPNAEFVAAGHKVTNNGDGTWTVERDYVKVEASADKAANGTELANAINATTESSFISLGEGEYKMPSINGSKEVTIVGTEETVIDVTLGAYMDSSKVSFEGVTFKVGTGKANGNGSDYAALYTPNVTYTNCTFDGPFRVGRDGATFINCTFKNLGNDYVWNMQNDTVFDGCTFNTDGKSLLLYADGPTGTDGIANVVVKNCVFNATKSAKAGAIANQSCAAIEIHNYGCGFNLTTSGNTYNTEYFSGEWRIKTYETRNAKYTVIVNGEEYTSIAIDGKAMTIDSGKNVTVVG